MCASFFFLVSPDIFANDPVVGHSSLSDFSLNLTTESDICYY